MWKRSLIRYWKIILIQLDSIFMVRGSCWYFVFLWVWYVVFLLFSLSGFEGDSYCDMYKLYIIIIGFKCIRLPGCSITDRQLDMEEIGQRKNCELDYSIILKFYLIRSTYTTECTFEELWFVDLRLSDGLGLWDMCVWTFGYFWIKVVA